MCAPLCGLPSLSLRHVLLPLRRHCRTMPIHVPDPSRRAPRGSRAAPLLVLRDTSAASETHMPRHPSRAESKMSGGEEKRRAGFRGIAGRWCGRRPHAATGSHQSRTLAVASTQQWRQPYLRTPCPPANRESEGGMHRTRRCGAPESQQDAWLPPDLLDNVSESGPCLGAAPALAATPSHKAPRRKMCLTQLHP